MSNIYSEKQRFHNILNTETYVKPQKVNPNNLTFKLLNSLSSENIQDPFKWEDHFLADYTMEYIVDSSPSPLELEDVQEKKEKEREKKEEERKKEENELETIYIDQSDTILAAMYTNPLLDKTEKKN
jgi:hypothetical protein